MPAQCPLNMTDREALPDLYRCVTIQTSKVWRKSFEHFLVGWKC